MAGPSFIVSQRWDKKVDVEDLTKLKIFINEREWFRANNLNIFTNYVITFFNTNLINKWRSSCDMTLYQNQLNFAVWCASCGCGVSYKDHLNSRENLLSSVFKFHIYFQTRRILEEMSCPLPGESIFNEMNNRIDKIKFQKLCNEFNISQNSDFRFKGGSNNGLGTMYNYHTNVGYRPVNAAYDPSIYQFVQNTHNGIRKIDYIKQDAAVEGWKQFLQDYSSGITRPGITRVDYSIREYVYCVLGSQAQTRSSILTSPETQQTFVDLLEQDIKSLFSIPESIARYENAITNTNVKIDYVIDIGLYMIPSDLVLNVGHVTKYNNNILIADESLKIGYNETVNSMAKANAQVLHQSVNTDASAPLNTDFSSQVRDKGLQPKVQAPAPLYRRSNSESLYLYLAVSLLAVGGCYIFNLR